MTVLRLGQYGRPSLATAGLLVTFGSFYVCANFGENRSRNATVHRRKPVLKIGPMLYAIGIYEADNNFLKTQLSRPLGQRKPVCQKKTSLICAAISFQTHARAHTTLMATVYRDRTQNISRVQSERNHLCRSCRLLSSCRSC